jgi:hypothetical protein
LANLLKGDATRELNRIGLHPLGGFPRKDGSTRSPWARGEWKVFLDHPDALKRAIRYVESNPLKEGKPEQNWRFVTPV